MKKCFIYGNCQTRIIKKILENDESFSSTYEISGIKIVHLLSKNDIAELEDLVVGADLFVHQNISDNYKGIPQLGTNYLRTKTKTSCQCIKVPVAYFTGYNPELIYFRNHQNNHMQWEFSDYHDYHILNLFYQGIEPSQIVKIIQNTELYNPGYALKNSANSLKSLISREEKLDIVISSFIKNYYQEHRLFHSFNHPGSAIMHYIVERILHEANLQNSFNERLVFNQPEVLNNSCFPIYPAIKSQLKLNFEDKSEYIIKSKSFSIHEVVEKFCKFYADNYDLVEFNVDFYKNKFSGVTNYQIPVNS